MSLRIYLKRQDIPSSIKLIQCNDKFFNSKLLRDTKINRSIMHNIDRAAYNSPDTFIGRDASIGALNKSMLSTGCKTLINIANYPDICFNVIECGQNVLDMLLDISTGLVLWEYPVIFVNKLCDVVVDNRIFTNTQELAKYAFDVLNEEELTDG